MSLLTTVLVFAGTSLFWVMTRAGGLADALAFALVAIAALVIVRFVPDGPVQVAAWLGVAVLPLAVRAALAAAAAATADSLAAPLFSSTAGLLSLTPLAYVALVGLALSLRHDRLRTACALAVFAIWCLATLWLPAPGADGRFGNGLTPALAILAPGLGLVIDRARQRPWVGVALVAAFAIAWNYWLMVQYTAGTIPKDGPVSFAALVRQQADVQTRHPYVYPFAFPANAWFAWREGLPVDRYELLAFEPRRDRLDLALDRRAARFLLDGWEPAAADGPDGHVWTRDRRASLAVPLSLAEGAVELTVTARARLEEPAVAATVGVEVNGREIGRFTAPPAAPIDVVLRTPGSVGAVWRAGYNLVTFVSHGVSRVDPGDQRPPGPLARRAGDRVWPVAIYRLRINPAPAP